MKKKLQIDLNINVCVSNVYLSNIFKKAEKYRRKMLTVSNHQIIATKNNLMRNYENYNKAFGCLGIGTQNALAYFIAANKHLNPLEK